MESGLGGRTISPSPQPSRSRSGRRRTTWDLAGVSRARHRMTQLRVAISPSNSPYPGENRWSLAVFYPSSNSCLRLLSEGRRTVVRHMELRLKLEPVGFVYFVSEWFACCEVAEVVENDFEATFQ